ncbi:MAG: PAS domain S-box protein, partial [Verrucomicrobiota bacterium]|nr:PAS domain S-box protein [Verrucomicrobiota bacterium]
MFSSNKSASAAEHLALAKRENYKRADHLFARLMVLQWLAGVGAALLLSPRTWAGAQSYLHPHVSAALFLGGAITIFPVYLANRHPGKVWTRHVIAIAQMMMSSLFVHLSGGRIETHFHVFGSLAFLAFYRDWRVVVTATVVTGLDHFMRGLFWPETVYGVLSASNWRTLEHVGWVLFEDVVLFISMGQSVREMGHVADRRAALEDANSQLVTAADERARSEMAERETMERYRFLADSMPQMVWTAKPDGNVDYYNQRWCDYTGLNFEQTKGWGWKAVLHPDDLQNRIDRWTEAVRTGHEYEGEFRFKRASDGAYRWHLGRAVPLRDAKGEILQWFGTCTDIEDQKRAEEELRQAHAGLEQRVERRTAQLAQANGSLQESEKRYRSLFEANPLPMWVYDLETLAFLEVNDAAISHYGYEREEFLAMTIADIRPAADKPALLANVSLAARRVFKVDHSGTWQHCKKDGSLIKVEITSHFVDHNGRRAELVLAFDVTERKRIEETLQRQQTELRVLFDLMPAMIWFKDTKNGILRVNKRVADAVGKSIEEIDGKSCLEIYPKEAAGFYADDLEVIHSGAPKLGIVEAIPGPEGKEMWVQTDKVPVRDKDEKVIGIVVMAQDVTERKRAELERQVISEIVQGVITTTNLHELFDLAHQSIAKVLYAENCFVALHEADTGLLHFDFWLDQVDPVPLPQPVGKGLSGSSYVLRTGRPLLLNDETKNRMREQGEVGLIGSDSASWLGVPLRTPSRIIGVLAVQHYHENDAYSQRDLEFLSTLGDQVALAIERKRAQEELKQSEEDFRTMANNISQLAWMADAKGYIFWYNQRWFDYSGTTLEEMAGWGWQ